MFMVAETSLYALFPIIVAYVTKVMPPILFAGVSTLVAAVFLGIYLLATRGFKNLEIKKLRKHILIVTIFIVVLPSIFIFWGSSITSGLNTAILLQSEMFFAIFICGFFACESITWNKILAAILIVSGSLLVMYEKGGEVNYGDLLIILGTVFLPIGNIYAKKALELTNPALLLFARSFLGGIVLILISFIFEHSYQSLWPDLLKNYPLILINGAVVYCLSKLLWYEGLKRIEISEASLISLGIYPIISMILAIIFLNETPLPKHIIGLGVILFGVFLAVQKNITNLRNSDQSF